MKKFLFAVSAAAIGLALQAPVASADPWEFCTPDQMRTGAGFNQCIYPGCGQPQDIFAYQKCVGNLMYPPPSDY